MTQSLLKPRDRTLYDRRIYNDEQAFVDRASWLDSHQITEDRRKPTNIVNENNHDTNCLVFASGVCCCDLNQNVIAELILQKEQP